MRTYLSNFPGVLGLIGSSDELARLQTPFGFVSQRQESPGGDYAINHTAATYVVYTQSKIQLISGQHAVGGYGR